MDPARARFVDSSEAALHPVASMEDFPNPIQEAPAPRRQSGPGRQDGLEWSGPWWNAGASTMNLAMPNAVLRDLGLVNLSDQIQRFASSS